MARFSPDSVEYPIAPVGEHHDSAYYDQLRRRLRWQLLAASVTPLLLISIYFHYQYSTTQTEGVHNHLKSVAENQRNTVDLYLRERVANLRSTFRKVTRVIDGSTPKLGGLLAALRQESAAFVDLGLFDAGGKLVAYAGDYPHLVGKDYRGEAWWKELHGGKADYLISDVYLGFRRRPHFIIAIRRASAGRQWTLRASVDPERFARFVRRPRLASESEAFIVNPEGQRQTVGEGGRQPPTAKPPSRGDGDVVVREVTVGGRDYIVAWAWLAEHNWALAVRVPREIAYQALNRARWILVSFTLVTLALIIWLVIRYTNRLVERLTRADKAQETLRQELFHAAKLASVGEMAAGVAHEINNPLAIIYEEAGMMKDIMDPQFGQEVDLDEFRERMDAIVTAALRGRDITRKLLAFSRTYEPAPELVDLNLIIERVVAARERTFELNEIQVIKELASDLPKVLVQPNQMDQVILNLLNNARDAIGKEGTITVTTGVQEGEVVASVRDTGCGISEAQMPQIFFPFYTTKGVGKGTGLGLSISYGILKSFDGRIEVESEVGKGSRFIIYLPVAKGDATERKAGRPGDGHE